MTLLMLKLKQVVGYWGYSLNMSIRTINYNISTAIREAYWSLYVIIKKIMRG